MYMFYVVIMSNYFQYVDKLLKTFTHLKAPVTVDENWIVIVDRLVEERHKCELSQEALAHKIGCASSLNTQMGTIINDYLLASYSYAGCKHWIVKLKSKKINHGQSAKCDICELTSQYFVCPVKSCDPPDHYVVCLNCYEKESWQAKLAQKATTTKTISSSSSKSGDGVSRNNRLVDHWEESILETSSSKSMDTAWWQK